MSRHKTNICQSKCGGSFCNECKKGRCNPFYEYYKDREGNALSRVETPKQLKECDNTDEIKAKVLNDLYGHGYITKQEVVSILKFDFGIEITGRKLKYFGEKGLIEPSLTFSLPGVTGKVSFYKKNTPHLISAY